MNDRYNDIKEWMEEAAQEAGVSPKELTKTQFFAHTEDVSEWEIRKLGGFASLRKLLFGEPERDVVMVQASRRASAHQRKLDRSMGDEEFRRSAFLGHLRDIMEEVKFGKAKPIKPKKGRPKATKRTLQAVISDTHFGCVIDPLEMAGANEYNPTIAARRLAYFTSQVVNYKTEHRDETDLVIVLNGDILAGIIHDQEWGVDLMTKQFYLALSILTQSIAHMAANFNSVRVVCQPGNHGRFMHKGNKGRQSSKKWDNFETMLYLSLSWALNDHTNITWDIPESPFSIYTAQGNNFLATHGDTVINVGNPGSAISMKSINEQVNKFNAAASIKVDCVVVGHVHVSTYQLLENGSHLVINGTLSGTDPFAQSIGIFSNNAAQTIFETTEKHAVGDLRVVTLKEADTAEELDGLIEAPEGNF